MCHGEAPVGEVYDAIPHPDLGLVHGASNEGDLEAQQVFALFDFARF